MFQERNSTSVEDVQLSPAAWDKIKYLTVLLHPFFLWTEVTSKTTAVSVHKAWAAYTSIFQHLEGAEAQLLRKSEEWKLKLADSVVAAHQKLAVYYSKTYGPGSDVYNWATVLDPMQKLETYKSPSFSADDLAAYDSSFRAKYTTIYSSAQLTSSSQPDTTQLPDEIDFADMVLTQ